MTTIRDAAGRAQGHQPMIRDGKVVAGHGFVAETKSAPAAAVLDHEMTEDELEIAEVRAEFTDPADQAVLDMLLGNDGISDQFDRLARLEETSDIPEDTDDIARTVLDAISGRHGTISHQASSNYDITGVPGFDVTSSANHPIAGDLALYTGMGSSFLPDDAPTRGLTRAVAVGRHFAQIADKHASQLGTLGVEFNGSNLPSSAVYDLLLATREEPMTLQDVLSKRAWATGQRAAADSVLALTEESAIAGAVRSEAGGEAVRFVDVTIPTDGAIEISMLDGDEEPIEELGAGEDAYDASETAWSVATQAGLNAVFEGRNPWHIGGHRSFRIDVDEAVNKLAGDELAIHHCANPRCGLATRDASDLIDGLCETCDTEQSR